MPPRPLAPYSILCAQLLPALALPSTFQGLPKVSRRWVYPVKGTKDNSPNLVGKKGKALSRGTSELCLGYGLVRGNNLGSNLEVGTQKEGYV